MKYFLIFILVLVVFIISVTLGANNDQVVTFNYLIAQGQYSVSTLLAVLFGIGFVLGWIVCGLFYLRLRLSLARAGTGSNVWKLTRRCSLPVRLHCGTPLRNKHYA